MCCMIKDHLIKEEEKLYSYETQEDRQYRDESLQEFEDRMEVVDMKIDAQQDHSDLIFI